MTTSIDKKAQVHFTGLLGAFAAIGHNVYRVVPDEVPILDRQNVALKRADDRRVC